MAAVIRVRVPVTQQLDGGRNVPVRALPLTATNVPVGPHPFRPLDLTELQIQSPVHQIAYRPAFITR